MVTYGCIVADRGGKLFPLIFDDNSLSIQVGDEPIRWLTVYTLKNVSTIELAHNLIKPFIDSVAGLQNKVHYILSHYYLHEISVDDIERSMWINNEDRIMYEYALFNARSYKLLNEI